MGGHSRKRRRIALDSFEVRTTSKATAITSFAQGFTLQEIVGTGCMFSTSPPGSSIANKTLPLWYFTLDCLLALLDCFTCLLTRFSVSCICAWID
mmetsp:Transcript_8261/g.16486  ORF Transcript_8261/g.16486 Transcript_8261/m.16486 type:complete len:95 (+) Transcript_8261:2246-2530(+)